jgi:hypothetical protein
MARKLAQGNGASVGAGMRIDVDIYRGIFVILHSPAEGVHVYITVDI